MMWRTVPRPPRAPEVFKADHPFIFYITARLRDNDDDNAVETDKILFMGKLVSPK